MKNNTAGHKLGSVSSERQGLTKPATPSRRLFNMPLEGEKYKIFQPIFDMKEMDDQVLTSAEVFVSVFAKRVSWVNTMIAHPPKEAEEEYAKLMYIEMIKSIVSGIVFGDTERSITTQLGPKKKELHVFDADTRKLGKDWTFL